MKAKDIKDFEIGEHCFGQILNVNGKDYNDLKKEDILEFIDDRFKNDINASILIRETFQNLLENLQYDLTESSNDTCEQCGNWNSYGKYEIEK